MAETLAPPASPALHDMSERSLFPRLSGAEIDALRGHGQEVELAPGDALWTEGDRDYPFFVVLHGRIEVTKQVGGRPTRLTVHGPGEFTGELSMLTGGPAIASSRALEPARVLRVEAIEFRKLIVACSPTTGAILEAMARRAYDVEAQIRQHEKLAALGRMSAGLAHELNNPASAARRAAASLREGLARSHRLAIELRADGMSPEQCRLLQEVQEGAADAGAVSLSDPLALADREDELAQWLEEQGVAGGWELAGRLVAAGLDRARLAPLGEGVAREHLPATLVWLASSLEVAALAEEIESSVGRISELVGTIKEYSHMGAAAPAEVDVRAGLDGTLRLLAHKLRGVTVERAFALDLPHLQAYGGELNQVWTNLLDNAADAARQAPGGKGRVAVRAARDNGTLVVEIADNGPGIPAEVQARIWEPFFTTKPQGQGTGLGLDIARRIVVQRHGGELRVASQPGETRFTVRLPLGLAPENPNGEPSVDKEIVVYGANWCHDTRDTLRELDGHGVKYTYIDVDQDPAASEWVKSQNDGRERKPTLKLGERILSVPSASELDQALREEGFSVGA